MKRRTFIRLLSFLAVAVVALGGFGVAQARQVNRWRTRAENEYARSFADLSEHLYNIETAFEKGQFAGTPYQVVRMANRIWRETGEAKAALEGMPEQEAGLREVAEFLSKAGDYAYYVSGRVMRGEAQSENEASNMKELAYAASQLANYVGHLRAAVDAGEIALGNTAYGEGYDVALVGEQWSSIREQVSEYPELIYDGPFSDHVEKLESVLLADASPITEEEAKRRLSGWLDIPEQMLEKTGEVGGKLEAWSFAADTKTVTITKKGGYLLELSDSRARTATGLSVGEAMNRAQEFFAKMGIEGMRQSYYMKSDGEITVNFAYAQNGVIMYPDLIKVTVCLETGEICGYEANGYLMAHRTDRDTAVVLSVAQAQTRVSTNLTVVGNNLAVIPTDGKNEVLCHEFVTKTADGRQVLVYVNAKTGIEEMIQILIETEGGTLTV